MTRPTYRSWSQLSSYEQCAYAFYLERVAKVPSAPAVWFPGGTAYHSATEAFDRYACAQGLDAAIDVADWGAHFVVELQSELDKYRAVEPDESKWRTAGSKLVAYKATGENVAFWLTQGPLMVAKYIAWRKANEHVYDVLRLPDGSPALETEMLTYFGTVQVKAFADLVLLDINTGATIVVDRKSGKNAPKSLDQLGVYRLGLEDTYKIPMWYGAYFMARTGQLHPKVPEPLEKYDNGHLTIRFENMDAKAKAGEFPPNITKLCDYCGVRKFCSYQGGKLP